MTLKIKRLEDAPMSCDFSDNIQFKFKNTVIMFWQILLQTVLIFRLITFWPKDFNGLSKKRDDKNLHHHQNNIKIVYENMYIISVSNNVPTKPCTQKTLPLPGCKYNMLPNLLYG